MPGEWPVNDAAARRYAAKTLEEIDFSKRDIVLYVSGTANPDKGEFPQINPHFTNAYYRVWQDGGAYLGLLRYESNWNMRASMATGVETLRRVLRAIAARPDRHRVFLAGESQGAWVIGEAIKDAVAGAAVTRAALWGHPVVAATHYDDGHDPRVLETNHEFDRVSRPISGDPQVAMDAMIALQSNLKPETVPVMARAIVQNPLSAGLSILNFVRDNFVPKPLRQLIPEPHDYEAEMVPGAKFLRHGTRPPAEG